MPAPNYCVKWKSVFNRKSPIHVVSFVCHIELTKWHSSDIKLIWIGMFIEPQLFLSKVSTWWQWDATMMMARMMHNHKEGPLRCLRQLWGRLCDSHYGPFCCGGTGSIKVLPCEIATAMMPCFVTMKLCWQPPKSPKVPWSGQMILPFSKDKNICGDIYKW